MRGAKVSDIDKKLTKPEEYESIIIHGGTNDCTKDEDVEPAKAAFVNLIKSTRDKAPETKIFVSTICPRMDDNGKNQPRVDNMNNFLKDIVNSTDKCEIIDNDLNFKLRNNDTDESALNGSKLHLSKAGTRKLLKNFHAAKPVIKSTRKSSNEQMKRTRPQNAKGDKSNNMTNKRGCYFCGEMNHQQKDCRHGKAVKCHTCGTLGHKQSVCKKH